MLEMSLGSKFALEFALKQFQDCTPFINSELARYGIIQLVNDEPFTLNRDNFFTFGGYNFWSPDLHQKSQELALENRRFKEGLVGRFDYIEPNIYIPHLFDLEGNPLRPELRLGHLRFIDPLESGFRVVKEGGALEELPQLQGQVERTYIPRIKPASGVGQEVLHLYLPLFPELFNQSSVVTDALVFDRNSGQQLEIELIQKLPHISISAS